MGSIKCHLHDTATVPILRSYDICKLVPAATLIQCSMMLSGMSQQDAYSYSTVMLSDHIAECMHTEATDLFTGVSLLELLLGVHILNPILISTWQLYLHVQRQ